MTHLTSQVFNWLMTNLFEMKEEILCNKLYKNNGNILLCCKRYPASENSGVRKTKKNKLRLL